MTAVQQDVGNFEKQRSYICTILFMVRTCCALITRHYYYALHTHLCQHLSSMNKTLSLTLKNTNNRYYYSVDDYCYYII